MNTSSIVYNAAGSELEAKKYTAAGSKNVNFGEMEFKTYNSGSIKDNGEYVNTGGAELYNNCMLFVDQMIAGGIIYLDHGVIAKEKEDDKNKDYFEQAFVLLPYSLHHKVMRQPGRPEMVRAGLQQKVLKRP